MSPAQYPLLLRWRNLARAEGFEPPSSGFPPRRYERPIAGGLPVVARQFAVELTPAFSKELSKTNKKPGAWPGPVHRQIHSDPQHTTPQMTRLVILAITYLIGWLISHTLQLQSTSVVVVLQFNHSHSTYLLEHLAGLEPA